MAQTTEKVVSLEQARQRKNEARQPEPKGWVWKARAFVVRQAKLTAGEMKQGARQAGRISAAGFFSIGHLLVRIGCSLGVLACLYYLTIQLFVELRYGVFGVVATGMALLLLVVVKMTVDRLVRNAPAGSLYESGKKRRERQEAA